MAQYFVVATDKFMSGWGRAKGKISKMVCVCESHQKADEILSKWEKRSDLSYLAIKRQKPYYAPGRYDVAWYDENLTLIDNL